MDANQARRRTDLDSVSTQDAGSISQPAKTFAYQPLDPDPDADSIRLALIEPSQNHDDPMSCSLSHVKFAEKPRYKALSYMWGDEAVKVDILLDGARFYVGRNLWDALHYLRNSGNQMPFWIDAICINQHDVAERNRQLAMMKWIYFRADTVVIWLGRKYLKYQTSTKFRGSQDIIMEESKNLSIVSETPVGSGEATETVPLEQNEVGEAKPNSQERIMVTELCSDGYWDRLWIIQEVGRAHQKEVCFGDLAMDWNAFIEMATLHNSSCQGPLRLNRLLQERYTGSHTLRELLEDHREALCKEPRDKIYGLVGLAADAIKFPMDYTKSLIEIWKDTIVFMNSRGLLPESDIISFGRLVKSLLIGDNLGPLEQVLRPYEPRPNSTLIIENGNSPGVFKLPSFVVGCILAVGPSTEEIISSLRKADDWASEIQRNFRHELGEAHRENDKLMRSVLEFSEARLASMCFSHVSNVRWLLNSFYTPTAQPWGYKDMIVEKKDKYASSLSSQTQSSSSDIRTATASSSRLFLVANRPRGQTPWKMGIASSLAQPGDLICWVQGVERALILRVTFGQERVVSLQGFGTALFTDDFDSNGNADHVSRLKSFSLLEKLDVQIDAATIYVLLA
jgi:hypothetical protein